jgi:hypothetical protein
MSQYWKIARPWDSVSNAGSANCSSPNERHARSLRTITVPVEDSVLDDDTSERPKIKKAQRTPPGPRRSVGDRSSGSVTSELPTQLVELMGEDAR